MASLVQYRIVSVSSETKPTVVPGPNGPALTVGSVLEWADTGAKFYWDGGQWVASPSAAPSVADWLALLFPVNVAIRQELTALRLGMTAAGLCSEVSAADLETELTVT